MKNKHYHKTIDDYITEAKTDIFIYFVVYLLIFLGGL